MFEKTTAVEQHHIIAIKAHALVADLTLGVGSATHQLCDSEQLI